MASKKKTNTTKLKEALKSRRISTYAVLRRLGVPPGSARTVWYQRLNGSRTMTQGELDEFFTCADVEAHATNQKPITRDDAPYDTIRLRLV